MRPIRFVAIVVYMAYLVNVGLLLVLLPWSRAWGRLLSMLPLGLAPTLDAPWLRGALSAFGVLHLLLVAWELVHPTLLSPQLSGESGSQDADRS
ncbi:MAG: hypothetical protein MUE90_03425 [Thermoanaerobaculales bacterium]|nr:hypothetical protein [Thermoanaerobaculales bacterium]